MVAALPSIVAPSMVTAPPTRLNPAPRSAALLLRVMSWSVPTQSPSMRPPPRTAELSSAINPSITTSQSKA